MLTVLTVKCGVAERVGWSVGVSEMDRDCGKLDGRFGADSADSGMLSDRESRERVLERVRWTETVGNWTGGLVLTVEC